MTDHTLDRRPAHASQLISDGLDTLGSYLHETGLHATNATVSPTARGWYDFYTDSKIGNLPGIRLELTPTEFLLWCEILNAPRVGVARRAGRTELSADLCRDGASWWLTATIYQPTGADRLPGASIAWNRNENGRKLADGYTTVPDLRNALATLGFRYENQKGEVVAVDPHGPTTPQIVRYSSGGSDTYPNYTAVPCTDCGTSIPAGERPPVWTDGATTCPDCTHKRRVNA
ncbi:hypothetical protein ACH4T9_12460 [Micromonospora sp. NPDC020750]|uniref:hypothetical protein n=1 Tax=unclassified Micromonospora TaxID=2617518 RepID=UPI00378B5EC2